MLDTERLVTFDGLGTSGVLILGESPWLDELRAGRPFAGKAGWLLDSQIKRCGYERRAFIVSNVYWAKPPYLGWFEDGPQDVVSAALQAHRHYWEELIDRFKPRCILTLGAIAMWQVLGRGGLDNNHSYVNSSGYGPVVCSYHPSHIQRGNNKLTQVLFFGLKRALEVATTPGWMRTPVTYLTDPHPSEMEAYLWNKSSDSSGVVQVPPSGGHMH
jgi:uracil-DNA glycosylase family 4